MRRNCLFCNREAVQWRSTCALHLDDPATHREQCLAALAQSGGHWHVFAGVAWPGADLRGRFLEHASFENANLRDARFDGADLSRASFLRADLRGASFVGCQLQVANFQDADLCLASLAGCHLEGTHFSGARLVRADLSGAKLVGAQFRQADLTDASFRNAHFLRTSFSNSNLARADFQGAELREVSALDTRGIDTIVTDDRSVGIEQLRSSAPHAPRAQNRPPRPSEFKWPDPPRR